MSLSIFFLNIYMPMNVSSEYPNREYELYLEKNIVVHLKDSRFLYGILKSYDQYNCISLNFASERIYTGKKYSENRLGLVSIRGECITFIGLCKQTAGKITNKPKYII